MAAYGMVILPERCSALRGEGLVEMLDDLKFRGREETERS